MLAAAQTNFEATIELFANGSSNPKDEFKETRMNLKRREYGNIQEETLEKRSRNEPSIALVKSSTGNQLNQEGDLTKKQHQLIEIKESRKLNKPTWHAPWKLKTVLSGHSGWVRCLAVDSSNEWFASGGGDRIIKIWDLASGTLKVSLTGHVATVRGLAISDRHPYLFSAGEDKQIKCWDLEYNKVIRQYHGHLSGIYCLSLHPTLDLLVTGGRDSTARVMLTNLGLGYANKEPSFCINRSYVYRPSRCMPTE